MRLGELVKDVKRRVGNLYYDACDGLTSISGTLEAAGIAEPVRFGAFQAIEGFKSVITFPFSVLKMPFYKNTRALAAHTLQYNVIQYALPLVAYHGLVRDLITDGLGVGVPYIYALDLCADAIFTRALINAYIMNSFNLINASTMTLPGTEEIKHLLKCNHRESAKLKGKILGPAYYAGKILLPSGLSYLPKIGWIFEYTFKPTAIGEGLAEVNFGNLCNDDRIEYFKTHNLAHLGMGLGVLVGLKTTAGLIYYFTGVNGFFLEDAILGALMPLITFHINTTRTPDEIKTEPAFDTFSPVRGLINDGIKRGSEILVPKLIEADNSGEMTLKLVQMWNSPLSRFTRGILHPKLKQDLKTFFELGPVNLLIKEAHPGIQAAFDQIDLVLKFPHTIERGLRINNSISNFLPFVPPKEHTEFVVSLLTRDTVKTAKWLEFAKNVIKYSYEYNPNLNRSIIRKPMPAELKLIEDYSVQGIEENIDELMAEFYSLSEPTSDTEESIQQEFDEIPSHSTKRARHIRALSQGEESIATPYNFPKSLISEFEEISGDSSSDEWEDLGASTSPLVFSNSTSQLVHRRTQSTDDRPQQLSSIIAPGYRPTF